MPNYTERLSLPVPLGNEFHKRAAFEELIRQIDASAARKELVIVAENEPLTQLPGEVWFQVGLGDSYEAVTSGGVMIKNAVVSDDQPATQDDIWLDT